MRIERQIKRLWQQVNLLKKMKSTTIWKNLKGKQLRSLTTQLKEINQNMLLKEERFKKYRDRVEQYRQNALSKFTKKISRDGTKTNLQLDVKETKGLWIKMWKQKEHNKNWKWINNRKKNFKTLRLTYTWNRLEQRSRKYRLRKCQTTKEYIDFG